jgi:hypothetical protein
MTFFSGTPQYEGHAQPTPNCSTGLFGWLNELIGFPCTPAYESDPVYSPPKGEPSCGDLPPEGYTGDVYVVNQ